MSKTKYIKVQVSERMPKVPEIYLTDKGPHKYSKVMNVFINEKGNIVKPSCWFKEVPDREDEMREMLERIVNIQYDSKLPLSSLNAAIQKAKQLLDPR